MADHYEYGPKSIVLFFVPVVSGSLSLVCSLFICFIILRDHQYKLKRVYYRLLLGVSIFDAISSAGIIPSALMVPRQDEPFWGNHGNRITCNFQGFLSVIGGFCTPIYNAGLCLFFLLTIRHSLPEERFRKGGYELACHLFGILLGPTYGTLAASFGLLNPVIAWQRCSVARYPDDCHSKERGGNCIRGGSVPEGVLPALFIGPHGAIFLLVVYSTVAIYLTVRSQERRMELRYNVARSSNYEDRGSKQVAIQAILYQLGFLFSFLWINASRFFPNTWSIESSSTLSYIVYLLAQFFFPLQGVWNLLIFLFPRYRSLRRRNPNRSFCHIIARIAATGDEAIRGQRAAAAPPQRRVKPGQQSNNRNSALPPAGSRVSSDPSGKHTDPSMIEEEEVADTLTMQQHPLGERMASDSGIVDEERPHHEEVHAVSDDEGGPSSLHFLVDLSGYNSPTTASSTTCTNASPAVTTKQPPPELNKF